jgi:hypothetical protein
MPRLASFMHFQPGECRNSTCSHILEGFGHGADDMAQPVRCWNMASNGQEETYARTILLLLLGELEQAMEHQDLRESEALHSHSG